MSAAAPAQPRKPKRHPLLTKALYAPALPAPLLPALALRSLDVAPVGAEESESESEEDSDDDDDDEDGDRRSARAAASVSRDAFYWFVTPTPAAAADGAEAPPVLEQTQLGIYRALLPKTLNFASDQADLAALQARPLGTADLAALQRAAGGTPLRKLKGGPAADEAAQMLGASFMDGRALLAGAVTEESSDSEMGHSDASDHEEAASSAGGSSIRSLAPPPSLRSWTIILLGGGHFSAAIVALNPAPTPPSKRTGASDQRFIVLAHKAFHRYTTRKKQGGGQAAQDATGRFAKSAGAQLRRYGEQALAEEIRELLASKPWREGIGASERVWVRAGKRAARGILWSWASAKETSPLEAPRSSGALQTIPFATRRPTVGEALRCFAELTRVKVRHETDEELAARDAAYRAQIEGGARERDERRQREKERQKREREKLERIEREKAEQAAAVLEPKEALRRDRLERLVEMLRKGRVTAAVSHLAKYERDLLRLAGWDVEPDSEPDDADDAAALSQRRINAPLPDWWRLEDARDKGLVRASGDAPPVPDNPTASQLVPSTILQLAAEGGHEEAVRYLLVERRADPTLPVLPPPGVAGAAVHRTAYDLCSSRAARDVFRRLMAAQPEWYTWDSMEAGGARVPSALTGEMEERQQAKVKDRRTALREKAKAREAAAAAKEAANPTPAPPPAPEPVAPVKESSATKNRLGGAPPARLMQQRDEQAGLSPEMRARIEREKRARAAEARFKALQGGGGAP
ncbi:hypothetical protein FA09DRAFT_358291 [Tilletiopsis washingtonensis]|uniref:VLRF1 domain-containing protein n=1 Tax=Tilletiopsis washingtonensis TaxID=58919 RepID=A0A316ZHF1_9BASI|nr:hypothetical protein FA09DRAFT_358291 [Tilletiopsis washingtonensis]PWO00942.1 hypothetical protein FA09DRAFT_358291 [Tilletiopsis washingtonensis]